jgi:hypothetical protein
MSPPTIKSHGVPVPDTDRQQAATFETIKQLQTVYMMLPDIEMLVSSAQPACTHFNQ